LLWGANQNLLNCSFDAKKFALVNTFHFILIDVYKIKGPFVSIFSDKINIREDIVEISENAL